MNIIHCSWVRADVDGKDMELTSVRAFTKEGE